jgi:hypothetical protein
MHHCYFSIHAHFYQPPRENPFTGTIPNEIGSAPFKNWNERIHAECYRPNADLHNFERISFNIGPTLSSWMEQHDSLTYCNIIEQDAFNVRRHGVGNAMAQAYNHTILPLASYHDKITQVSWGIADFEHRFRRHPQGMWLPETAVDDETLRVLTAQGIEFTILAPWQADANEIDTTEPYRARLSNGRLMTVFLYDKDLSGRVSFDPGVTINADSFALNVLKPHFKAAKLERNEAQLILVASDGELYGHHQRMRDRFLARLVDGASSSIGIQAIYPALWLKSHPPSKDICIREDTSWSCHHGVGRWTGQCPCTPGDGMWKLNFRKAFDHLAAELDGLYFEMTRGLVGDPWMLRNLYIHVMLGEIPLGRLLSELSGKAVTSEVVRRTYLMLESQRERQRMYTSCGWYFDDLDRIEPKNNVAYAAQAVHLARLASGVDLEPIIVKELSEVVGPKTKLHGDQLFQRQMQRAEERV